VKAFTQHLTLSLRLHFRNRLALIYGYLFPLIFLAAFWVLYRHEQVPLLQHMGELLTVSVLGGACFGLPTTLVSERERGVWRRYRIAPVSVATLLASTVAARYVLVLTAGALQFAVALAVGMTPPSDPVGLFVAFTLTAFALIGLGTVIAALADNVPAVQALGQCVFLPMLIIGGVAVPLASLPEWAQHVSAFFPGRYAVESMQACVTGGGLRAAGFDLVALGAIGLAAFVAGAKLFRWDAGQIFSAVRGKAWAGVAFAGWLAVGAAAEWRDQIEPVKNEAPVVVRSQPWKNVTEEQVASIDLNQIPPDDGLVTPMAGADQAPSDAVDMKLAEMEGALPHWQPGYVEDRVQRARNLLCVAALPDLMQNPVERWAPHLVLRRLESEYPGEDLVKVLTWIALHPSEGKVITSIEELGIEGAGTEDRVRERMQWYAMKFVAKVTGRMDR
jgi:ABC-2 type transport system permease protein